MCVSYVGSECLQVALATPPTPRGGPRPGLVAGGALRPAERWRCPAARSAAAAPGSQAGAPPGLSRSRSCPPPRTAASRTGCPCTRTGTRSARCCGTSLRSGSAGARCRRRSLQNGGVGVGVGRGEEKQNQFQFIEYIMFQLKKVSIDLVFPPPPCHKLST